MFSSILLRKEEKVNVEKHEEFQENKLEIEKNQQQQTEDLPQRPESKQHLKPNELIEGMLSENSLTDLHFYLMTSLLQYNRVAVSLKDI